MMGAPRTACRGHPSTRWDSTACPCLSLLPSQRSLGSPGNLSPLGPCQSRPWYLCKCTERTPEGSDNLITHYITIFIFFSGDFSDMSYDDDGDGDGKLVIAEGDDLDIKMENLGEDGKPMKKPRRKHNRFNGMSEEEVMKRLLPDLLVPDLDILIVSIHRQTADPPALHVTQLPSNSPCHPRGSSGQKHPLLPSPSPLHRLADPSSPSRWGSTLACTRPTSSTTTRARATTSVSSSWSPSETRQSWHPHNQRS